MTVMGWIFMIVCWSVLSFFTGWCIVKVLQPSAGQSMDADDVPHTN
jgi:hypothetical protein